MKSKEEITSTLIAEAKEKAEQLWMEQQQEIKTKIDEFAKSMGCQDSKELIKLIDEANGVFRYKVERKKRVKLTPELEEQIKEKAKLQIPKDIAACLGISIGMVNKVIKSK